MNYLWRTAHYFYQHKVNWLARFLELLSFEIGSNAISAKANIDKSTTFHHNGLGCVVHDNTVIGSNCHIFQNVTFGSKWTNGANTGDSPVIGNNVTVCAGAVIAGGGYTLMTML